MKATFTANAGYEQDYNLWLQVTIERLRNGAFEDLDLDPLIEEIEGLTKSERRELRNRLRVLLEHLLKLAYWEAERERCARGWKNTIREQRRRVNLLLQDSPSLKPFLNEIFADCYTEAREDAIEKTELPSDVFPEVSPFSLGQILDLHYLLN